MVDASSLDAWHRHLGARLDPTLLRAELVEGTLSSAFDRTAGVVPDAPALEIDGVAATHGEVRARAVAAAAALRTAGISRGDRVLLAAPTSLDLVAAYLGTLRAGAIAVPVDARSTSDELRHVVEDSEPAAVVATAEVVEVVRGLDRTIFAHDVGAAPLASPGEPARDDGQPVAMIAYTSGTTGRPKGAVLTHACVLASIRGAMLAWHWSADDVLVHALPVSHQHGLSGVHATLLAGSRAVLLSRFDADRVCEAIELAGATVLFAVPTMYEQLLGVRPDGLRRLRLPVSGSAPLPDDLAHALERKVGMLPLERYGSTEAGLDLSNLAAGPRRAGRVGWPLPGVEARREPSGELVVRGPQVFPGYWRRPRETESAFAGAWFRTGDLVEVDADGCFAIVGRLKEVIISGGLNVYPAEVERVLLSAPGILDAAVAGVRSERWGEEVVAYVVCDADRFDPDSARAYCRERLSPYKCPKRFLSVDVLPRNRLGKLERRRLGEMTATDMTQGKERIAWS